jgi:hypothetical protein
MGFYQLEGPGRAMHGFGEGDFVRLRDDRGNLWHGTVDVSGDDSVRYRFKDERGNSISGVSDSMGILLRDDKGNTWRGYIF